MTFISLSEDKVRVLKDNIELGEISKINGRFYFLSVDHWAKTRLCSKDIDAACKEYKERYKVVSQYKSLSVANTSPALTNKKSISEGEVINNKTSQIAAPENTHRSLSLSLMYRGKHINLGLNGGLSL